MKPGRCFIIICLLLVVFCTGCASKGYWHKSDRSPGPFTEEEKAQFRNDLYVCDKDSRVSSVYTNPFGGISTSHGNDWNYMYRCMRLRGYEWVKGTPKHVSYDPLKQK